MASVHYAQNEASLYEKHSLSACVTFQYYKTSISTAVPPPAPMLELTALPRLHSCNKGEGEAAEGGKERRG